MKVIKRFLLLLIFPLTGCVVTTHDMGLELGPSPSKSEKLVIAHRGASGYLPEHTIAAKAMAYAQGADYIEQDLVMTKDNHVIVLHDEHLDTVSNVADLFPGRDRHDGRFYAIDFTLQEIRQLSVFERFETENSKRVRVFGDRFPLGKSTFRIHTFAEEIELIQGLNESTGKSVGIYPEIKSPGFHRDEGKDIASAALRVLNNFGYSDKTDLVFFQCFDEDELRRVHSELMPEMNMSLKLVQLMSTEKQYHWMLSADGMTEVATYADGIGPSALLLISRKSTDSRFEGTQLVEFAHSAGMVVHPYTFRRERDQMPPFAANYDEFLGIFLDRVGVDGVFTDFPDLTVEFLERKR